MKLKYIFEFKIKLSLFLNQLLKANFSLLIGWYFSMLLLTPLIGIPLFIVILPFFSVFGVDFSNLGPIITVAWGVLFDIFFLTPLFLILSLKKFVGYCFKVKEKNEAILENDSTFPTENHKASLDFLIGFSCILVLIMGIVGGIILFVYQAMH